MLYYTYDQTIQQHHCDRYAMARSPGVSVAMLGELIMAEYATPISALQKKNRLRQLVQWEYITQPEANQLWHEYLRLFKQVNGK